MAEEVPPAAGGAGFPPADSSKLRVVCRLRPLSEQERRAGTMPSVTASTERREVVAVRAAGDAFRQARLNFTFDHVLSSFSTQLDVFNVTLKPLIKDVLGGYEAAIFAYGQTGTGKTYTMEGEVESSERRGLVPRAAEALIRALMQGSYSEYSLTASCLEIYNEELIDLLALPQAVPQKLDLMETGHGVCCVGLSDVAVSSVAELQELIRRAQERRRVAESRINARSSRSHCLFTLKVCCTQRVEGGEIEARGKLHLVDLAGSECARKADERGPFAASSQINQEASTKGERERRNINQSLLTLGRVISALRAESSRVPYRDSKLTRMLQEALGGGCRTVMIATISPALMVVDETISTLQYAEQAAGIHNRPTATLSTVRPGRSPISMCGGESRSTVGFGDAGNSGSSVDGRSEAQELEYRLEYLMHEVEEAHAAFDQKQKEAQELQAQVDAAEAKCQESVAQLHEVRQEMQENRYALSKMAQFADERKQEVDQLVGALDGAREQCTGLAKQAQEQARLGQAMRRQARDLWHSWQQRASDMAGDAKSSLASLASSFPEAQSVHQGAVGGLSSAARKHVESIETLVGTMRSHSSSVHDSLASAAAGFAAPETVAAETEREMLSVIGDAARKHTAAMQEHSESAAGASARLVADQSAAAARSGEARRAVGAMADVHKGSCQRNIDCFRRELCSLDDALSTHGEALKSTLSSTAAALAQALADLTKASSAGVASTEDVISAVQGKIIELMAVAGADISKLRELLDNTLVNLRDGNLAASLGEAVQAERSAHTSVVEQEAAAIASAHEGVAKELVSLREQLAADRSIIGCLAKQREDLSLEVGAIQEAVSGIAAGAKASQEALQAAQDSQRQRRKAALGAILRGVESLVVGEFDGLERELADSCSPISGRLAQIGEASASSMAKATRAAGAVNAASSEASSGVSSLVAAANAHCDSIESTHESAAEAARRWQEAAGTLLSRLQGVEDRIAAWGRSCEEADKTLGEAKAATASLDARRDALRPEWVKLRSDAETASRSLFHSLDAVAGTLGETSRQHTEESRAAHNLTDAASARRAAMGSAVELLAGDAQQHTGALAELQTLLEKDREVSEKECAFHATQLAALSSGAASLLATAHRQRDASEACWRAMAEAANVATSASSVAQDARAVQAASAATADDAANRFSHLWRELAAGVEAQSSRWSGLAELPAVWRDGLAAPPLDAFNEGSEVQNKENNPFHEDVAMVKVSTKKRPSEEDLIMEFRRGPPPNQLGSIENQYTAPKGAAGLTPRTRRLSGGGGGAADGGALRELQPVA